MQGRGGGGQSNACACEGETVTNAAKDQRAHLQLDHGLYVKGVSPHDDTGLVDDHKGHRGAHRHPKHVA